MYKGIIPTLSQSVLDGIQIVNTVVSFTIYEVFGVTIISFVIGFGTGYIVSRKTPEGKEPDIRMRVAIFITLVWSVSVIATIFVPTYQTSIWVHAIMGGITGYMFGIDNPLMNGFSGGGNNGK